MANTTSLVSDFLSFLNASPTAFHAVDESKRRLRHAGYEQISERDDWKLEAGKKYFFTRNYSTIVAFAVGKKYEAGNGFHIIGAHTDSPCLKLKPVSKVTKGGCLEVGVQTYGGGLWYTWFDRDLTVAGRVIVKEDKAGSVSYSHRLVRIEDPIMRIPTLAIHLDRNVNSEGFKPNTQTHLVPILATAIKAELNKVPAEGGEEEEEKKMYNPSRKTSKHINLNLLALTFHLIFIISTVHSQSTQRLTEPNSITELIVATLNQTILNVNVSYTSFFNLQKRLGPNIAHRYRCAFEDCLGLLDDTISNLETAIFKLQTSSVGTHDVNMLLSDAMTNQDTCLEGFTTSGIHENNNDNTYKLTDILKDSILKISSNLSDSLGMLQKIPRHKHSKEAYEVDVEFPSWVLENDKRRLHAPVKEIKFNLMVAQDGTGNFTTINAAVSAAPNSSATRFVIYIKRGVYFENVEIPNKKTMIMFVGDGTGRTVIKANRYSTPHGRTTYQTATVGVKGEGFIAKDISFVNFAGPFKGQAVAFRSGSNHSAFYRCSFEGYQDTLYVHSAEQFYRECDIYGTIDFVFGNAAVVFQNCSLYARKPNPGQKIVYTAQSRTCPNQSTGISMINCRFLAAPDLIPVKGSFEAYLGRPWKNFSRTIIMKSFIDDLVVPAGWLEWNGNFALETLHYGEYMNEGPGSNITNRVKWPGYRPILNETEATQFTVGPFIDGGRWLNSTGIPFNTGL